MKVKAGKKIKKDTAKTKKKTRPTTTITNNKSRFLHIIYNLAKEREHTHTQVKSNKKNRHLLYGRANPCSRLYVIEIFFYKRSTSYILYSIYPSFVSSFLESSIVLLLYEYSTTTVYSSHAYVQYVVVERIQQTTTHPSMHITHYRFSLVLTMSTKTRSISTLPPPTGRSRCIAYIVQRTIT